MQFMPIKQYFYHIYQVIENFCSLLPVFQHTSVVDTALGVQRFSPGHLEHKDHVSCVHGRIAGDDILRARDSFL